MGKSTIIKILIFILAIGLNVKTIQSLQSEQASINADRAKMSKLPMASFHKFWADVKWMLYIQYMGSIDLTDVDKGAMLLTFSKVGITQSDFRIFAFMCLTITSFFSAIIISNIRHGDTRAGVKTIPVFIILTIAFFLIESYFFRLLFGGLL